MEQLKHKYPLVDEQTLSGLLNLMIRKCIKN